MQKLADIQSRTVSRPAAGSLFKRTRQAVNANQPYRTLETAHFVLHYTLNGIHRIKTTPADQPLLRLLDSIYASLPGNLSGTAREAAAYAKLDAASAPHPVFAATMAEYLEGARADYVGTLKMKAPRITVPSYYYRAPANRDGKYAVEIADLVTVVNEDHEALGESGANTYGLTLPPAAGGMLIENDFLFNAKVDPVSGIPDGDSIKSCYPHNCLNGGDLLHNYVLDWQAGLKVTCFHEFYHAVQFAYTPEPVYHTWYETGAVAMEERNAPEVNDYLQYMEDYFSNLASLGMFDYYQSSPNSNYGNGMFHRFLAQELGDGFDADVWSRLEEDGNNLKEALPHVFATHGESAGRIYSRFAAQLAFSGKSKASLHAPFPLFSPDMALWPELKQQTADLPSLASFQTNRQPPFTISAVKLIGASLTHKSLILQDTSLAPVLLILGSDSSHADFPGGLNAALGLPDLPGHDVLLLLANASLSRNLQAEIRDLVSIPSATLFAYPNPFKRNGSTDRLLFSRLPKSATINIYGENGIQVRSLAFTPDSLLWNWDLGNDQGQALAPGLYYFGNAGEKLLPLVLY